MIGEDQLRLWQPVRHLLAASQSRVAADRPPTLVLSITVAFANLLLCVLFENPIKDDPGGGSLSAFFCIQGMAIFLLTLAHISSTTVELLRKSLLMPVSPSARLAFAVVSVARHPVLIALVSADIFFLLVLFHGSVVAVVTIPILTLLMAADIIALTSLASVAAIRRSRSPTIVAAYCILGILGILAIGLLFHVPSAIGVLPPISWTTQGILAIISGRLGLALLWGSANIALLLLAGIFGRRFV